MAVHFLVRPPRVIKRVLAGGDIAVAAPAAFTAVPGTRMKFNVSKYSLMTLKIQGSIQGSAAAILGLDIAIDGVRRGQTNGLQQHGVVAGTVNTDLGFALDEILDDLTEGEHTFELQVKASAGNATLRAAAASCPLTITLVENAAIHPPPGVD